MRHRGWLIVGLTISLLFALSEEAWTWHERVASPGIEASLEAVEGRLVLALSASAPKQDTGVEAIQLRVEVFLEEGPFGLSPIGEGGVSILPGASLRLPIVIGEPGGEAPVRVSPGTPFLLTIYLGSRLVLYRQGPLQVTEHPPLGTVLRLERRDRPARRFAGTRAGTASEASGSSRATNLAPARTAWRDVSVAMRLLAAETEEEAGQLIVEVAAPDLSGEGVFEIEWQGRRSQRRLRLGPQANLRMPLPSPDGPLTGVDDVPHHAHPIRYALRGAQGDLLLTDEVTLVKLMEQEEAVQGEVSLFQFDRTEYLAGESLEIQVRIRGRANAGYRLVLVGRQEGGGIFSRAETEVPDSSEPLSLVIALPTSLRPPAVLEYQLLNRQTGFLYQSGQQQIPLRP